MAKKFYEVLNVADTASPEELRKAYRKKSLELHPDRNPGNEAQATAKYQEVVMANEILSDVDKRKQYDNGQIDDKGSVVRMQAQPNTAPQNAQPARPPKPAGTPQKEARHTPPPRATRPRQPQPKFQKMPHFRESARARHGQHLRTNTSPSTAKPKTVNFAFFTHDSAVFFPNSVRNLTFQPFVTTTPIDILYKIIKETLKDGLPPSFLMHREKSPSNHQFLNMRMESASQMNNLVDK